MFHLSEWLSQRHQNPIHITLFCDLDFFSVLAVNKCINKSNTHQMTNALCTLAGGTFVIIYGENM